MLVSLDVKFYIFRGKHKLFKKALAKENCTVVEIKIMFKLILAHIQTYVSITFVPRENKRHRDRHGNKKFSKTKFTHTMKEFPFVPPSRQSKTTYFIPPAQHFINLS